MDLVYKNEKTLFAISTVIAGLLWLIITVSTLGIILIYLLLGYLFFLFAHSAFITHLKGNGVQITQEQYPDLYESLKRNSDKVGLGTVPEAYLLRTDFFNALATRFRGRNFVVLFTDVIDALEKQPSAIDFYIGHELGHLHRKHLQWAAFLFPAAFIPLLGAAYRRAQEYTCDRYGAMCCSSEHDVIAAISTMSSGDTRWNSINLEAYLKQVNETNGFWMSFNEINNDYPWLTKRMAAALAFRQQQVTTFPRRHAFAWFLSAFIPRFGGGAMMSMMMMMAMLGILAAVALPAYQDYVEKAQMVGVKSQVEIAYINALPLQIEVEDYATKNDAWPVDLADIGLAVEDVADVENFYEIDIYNEGIIGIKVWVNDEDEQYIVLEPTYDKDEGITWSCYGQDLAESLVPDVCR